MSFADVWQKLKSEQSYPDVLPPVQISRNHLAASIAFKECSNVANEEANGETYLAIQLILVSF